MPRSTVPCAGCAKPLAGGKDSLPAGVRTCRPCRATLRSNGEQVPGRFRHPCSACGGPTPLRRADGRASRRATCSAKCTAEALADNAPRAGSKARQTWPCQDCGTSVHRHANGHGPLCDPCRAIRRRAHYRRKNAVRRGAAPVGPRMSIGELGRRDGWRCHLCRKRVRRHFVAPDPRSPTFDHLVPVSAGGDDSPGNLRLAHFGCNSRRGAGGIVQLILFG